MHHSHSAAGQHARSLILAVLLSAVLLVVELGAGLLSNSLALMADAGHLFADVSGMVLSLAAVWIAARPRNTSRTFGLYRLEILAAAANAIVLLGIAAFILYEAIRRFTDPPQVQSTIVVAVALLGLVVNLISIRLLAAGRSTSLTIRGVYLEVLGDLLGSVSVLVAGLVILTTGWHQADAVASIVVAVLIVPRTVALLRDSMDVLLEATPKGVDLGVVEQHIREAPGVQEVHDLHAWTITSGMNVLSAHVVLTEDGQPGDVLDYLASCLSDDFDINHSTFQLETPEHVIWEARSAQPRH
jgi:cobalt-zinc-cadmium efflux system protein